MRKFTKIHYNKLLAYIRKSIKIGIPIKYYTAEKIAHIATIFNLPMRAHQVVLFSQSLPKLLKEASHEEN